MTGWVEEEEREEGKWEACQARKAAEVGIVAIIDVTGDSAGTSPVVKKTINNGG